MRVLFAPDWHEGVPYQRLLAEALRSEGETVSYLRDYRRLLPLGRLVRAAAKKKPVDLLHLHWPEAYYPRRGDRWDTLRAARYPLDLTLARRGRALVVTAHNLHTHNFGEQLFEKRNTLESFSQAQRIIAHSAAAKAEIINTFRIEPTKIAVIPHGDLSVTLGAPLKRAEARHTLGLGEEKIVLMFGAIEPYKGIEEVIDCWRQHTPEAELVIIGRPISPAYEAELAQRAAGVSRSRLQPGWLADDALRQWLSACDAVVFNYRTIFTSGAATLARSYGIPLLLPERLKTVWLDEPHPLVRRFSHAQTDLAAQLADLINQATPNYEAAAGWRAATAWAEIAKSTARVYHDAAAAVR